MRSILLGGFWLAAGLAIVWLAKRHSLMRRERAAWLTTRGKTTEKTKMVLATTVEGPSYYPLIEYRYQVGGKEYSSWRVYSNDVSADSGSCERLFKRYKGEVTVHYNPTKPEEAFLLLNARGWIWCMYAFVVFCFFLAALYILPVLFP